MSEVIDAPQSATSNLESTTSAQGSHIWYELLTPDPEGAKAFYGAVVPGWTIGDRIPCRAGRTASSSRSAHPIATEDQANTRERLSD